MPTRTRDARPGLFLITFVVIALDRLSKLWVKAHIPAGSHRTLIPNVFYLSHVLNTGAAWSLFADSVSPSVVRWGLIAFSVAAVLLVGFLLWRVGAALTITSFALALILGGAIGNLYDRIRFASVTDFLEVHIVHYHYPDFNVADSCIVIGACLLLLEILRTKPEPSPTTTEPEPQ